MDDRLLFLHLISLSQVSVYGFTRSYDKDKKDTKWVSQISPIVNILSSYKTAEAFAGDWFVIAATTDGHLNDWVYFFKLVPCARVQSF